MNKFGSNRTAQQKSSSAAPAAASKPTHVLKMKGDDGKLVTITGLFPGVAKNGEEYLSGTDRESGIKYVVYLKTDIVKA